MKYLVSELEGARLDAAVAKAEGLEWSLEIEGAEDSCAIKVLGGGIGGPGWCWSLFSPSDSWLLGGPIIERERINLQTFVGRWEAFAIGPDRVVERLAKGGSSGPTPLIAAMRAYVVAKFGDEVELP